MTRRRNASGQSFPRPERRSRIYGEYQLIELIGSYRGKTNVYTVERQLVHSILDHLGNPVEPNWSEKWTEISPGIETRSEHRGTQWKSGDRSQESYVTGCLRIHRHACPVYVQFEYYREYVDYDYTRSSTESQTCWVRYEK